METTTLNTPTATCGSCRAHIQEVMDDVAGVSSAQLDLRNRQTTVTFDPAVIDQARIINIITDAGYPVDN